MFGQKDDDKNDEVQADAGTPSTDLPLPSVDAADQAWQHPGVPMDGVTAVAATEPASAAPAVNTAPADPFDIPTAPVTDSAVTAAAPAIAAPADDLLSIKQQALTQLTPLVGQLDQTPEEKFRTTMMMIQASDDKTMIKVAYEAAQSIVDEKLRAQALLDVINEINYFTSPQE